MDKREYKTVEELLFAPECENLQLKEAKEDFDFSKALKICCALSNCGGGKLALGISDKRPRSVVGSLAFTQPERTCSDLSEKLQVPVAFDIFNYQGKRVLVFNVSPRPQGMTIQANGEIWWYKGDSLIRMPDSKRREIEAEVEVDYSSQICYHITIDDLDDDAVERYRKELISHRHNEHYYSLSKEDLLRACRVLTDKGCTYAALILFGKTAALQEHLNRAGVVFQYRDSEVSATPKFRKDLLEPLFNYFDKIWELINTHNPLQLYEINGAKGEIYTFNYRTVREAFLNAVAHRDYRAIGNIIITQYTDDIVFDSTGPFLTGISPENILHAKRSRNTTISDVLLSCGLVEGVGQGVDMMCRSAISEGKALPDFSGSSTMSVNLRLKGKVYNKYIIEVIKRLTPYTLSRMTVDDYIVLADIAIGKLPLDNARAENCVNLIKLDIWNQAGELLPKISRLFKKDFKFVKNILSQPEIVAYMQPRRTVPAFPVECLPLPVSNICKELASIYNVSVALPSAIALGYLATCCQKNAIVRYEENLLQQLNLFMLVVSDAETANEDIFQLLCDPIKAFQAKYLELNEHKVAADKIKYEILKKEICRLKNSISRAKSPSDIISKIVSLESEYQELLDNFPEKIVDQYITREKMIEMFELYKHVTVDSSNGMIVESFKTDLNTNIDNYLAYYANAYNSVQDNGISDLSKTRSISLVSACSSKMVCEMLGNKFLQRNKLLSKFVFSNCSSKDEGSNFKSIKHSNNTTVAYNSLICKLLDNRFNVNVNLRELTLSKEASELYPIYREDTLGKYKTTVMKSAFIKKLALNFDKHMLRVAGILAICADMTEIDGETMKNAIKISDWFLESAFSLYMDNSDIFKSDIE